MLIVTMCVSRSEKIKHKAIPVTGDGGLQGCEMLRIPHCPDNRLTDSGKVRCTFFYITYIN
jgi:hypothetical protein